MKQSLLSIAALLLVLSSASAIAPRQRYSKSYNGAAVTRSLFQHSGRYLAEVRGQWKNQPVPVNGGYRRYSPFSVLGTAVRVEKSDSPTAAYFGYVSIRVRYRETAVWAEAREALRAPFRGAVEYTFEPVFAYRQGKWIPTSEE